MINHEVKKISSNSENATYIFSLKIPMDIGWIENVKIVIEDTEDKKIYNMNYVKNCDEISLFELQITLQTKAIYHYYFSFDSSKYDEPQNNHIYKKINKTGSNSISIEEMWKLSVNFDVPDWAQGGIMYHIFLDRYRRGSKEILENKLNKVVHKSWDEPTMVGPNEDGMWNIDFFGGDFEGIEETLSYLEKLGVDIIYISPIVESQSNHGYDTADYLKISSYAGNDENLKSLCQKAHEKGMKIILDGVFNHVGNDSKYFNQCNHYNEIGAFQSDKSKYSNFFRKNPNNAPKDKKWYIINRDIELKDVPISNDELERIKCSILEKDILTNKWQLIDSQGFKHGISDEFIESISYALKPNEFDYWWGMVNMPECDGNSKDWQNYIYGVGGVIDHWFNLGIDGLRLDVADELTDEFIEGIRSAARRNKPDAFVIGEVWENPMRMKSPSKMKNPNLKVRGYVVDGKGLDSVMNYQWVDALIRYFKYSDCQKLKDKLQEIFSEYPDDTINSLMNFTSTHDISRAIEIFGVKDGFQNPVMSKWAWDLEIENYSWAKTHNITKYEYKKGKEIFKTYLYCLAFLPGTISIFYGDEVGMAGIGNLANRGPYPWKKRDKDLLNFMRNLMSIRKSESFLKKAKCRVLKIDSEQFIFERFNENNKILVAVSISNNETKLEIPVEYENAIVISKNKNCDKNSLAPLGAIVLKI